MPYIILITLLVAIDQVSKYTVDSAMMAGDTIPVITNFFHITYVQNYGMAFGLFQGKIDIIGILTFVAIICIGVYMYRERKKMDMFDKMGYSFIMAGAIGNLLDRITRGFVVDMIDFRGIWIYIFNLADVWINLGVLFIIVNYFWNRKKDNNKEKEVIK